MTSAAPRRGVRLVVGGLAGLAVLAAVAGILLFLWLRPAGPVGRDWTALWQSQPPVVTTTPGGLLETATVRMSEDFYRSDSRSWWGLYLGTTVSQIQVAVVYRYGVPLADPGWKIVTRGPIAVVVAPPLRPSLPVAIDTATLQERTASGWARFDKAVQLEELRRSMSADLAGRAAEQTRVALVVEASRRTIAEFAEAWLLARGEWQQGAFTSVKVYFTDELDEGLSTEIDAVR
jgi:hypothetical protein